MVHSNKIFGLIVVVSLTNFLTGDTTSSFPVKSRRRRFLVWQEGTNWVQFVAGIGLPTEIRDQSITMGAVLKAFYLLPTNSSYYTNPTIEYARRKRSTTRWVLYSVIEKFIERFGYGDGKACLLRTICEAASVPFDAKSGLLAEIAHALLTPSSTDDTVDNHVDHEYHAAERLGRNLNKCEALFPECSLNVINRFSRLLT